MAHNTILPLTPTEIERFWSKVQIGATDECWPWIKCVDQEGYGRFTIRRAHRTKQLKAHRISHALHHKCDPCGLKVLHTCDNPPCCNPNHSFRGTQADNIRDMKRKGRWRVASNVKLTADQVRSIRNSVASGKTYKRVADDFGVCMSTVAHIIEGRSWSWLSIVG